MSKHFGVLFLSIILFSVTIAEEHELTRKKRQNSCGGCGTVPSQQGYVNYPISYQSPQYQPSYQGSAQYTYGQQYPTSYLNPTGQTYQYPTSQYTSSQQYQTPQQYQPTQYQATSQYQAPQYQPVQYQPPQYQQSYQPSTGCGGSSCSCPGGFTICFHYYGPSRCCSKK